jgi:hypothetical protein
MENNLDDPKNIAGLSSLLRDDDLESNMDLAELEKEIANGAHNIIQQNDINVADEYKKEMNRLSRNFDIPTYKEEMQPEPIQIPTMSSYNSPRHNNNSSNNNNWQNIEDNQLKNMTIEEQKQDKLNHVLRDIDERGVEFNIDKEREDDDKSSLLEQIDMLKITLEDDGIDISNVPQIGKSSNMKDIQNIYKILRLKNDRNRYCSFAEELILSGAYGLEYLFDGKKDWWGRKPDLTDWSSTVKVKLRRLRYETSTFVSEVMHEYNLSPGFRLALELVPSMFLYSRSRRISQTDNLVNDNQYKDAISNLNSL